MANTINQCILKEIVEIICNKKDLRSRVPAEQITPDLHWGQDMGFDSLAILALVYELQDKHPWLEETAISNWKTVDDLIKEIRYGGE